MATSGIIWALPSHGYSAQLEDDSFFAPLVAILVLPWHDIAKSLVYERDPRVSL